MNFPGYNRSASGYLLAGLLLAVSGEAFAERISVAVASNFVTTLRQLAEKFEGQSDHGIDIASASTGKLYAQIRHGAPYDLFMAADAERPALLEEQNLIVPDSRKTFALGSLVLWSPSLKDGGEEALTSGNFRYLSLANPRHAPYGRAARQYLETKGLWSSLNGKMVRGENIGQAYQFVKSGHADLGFIAYSQIINDNVPDTSFMHVPAETHEPIIQQVVLLKDTEAGRSFLEFVVSSQGRDIIRKNGYRLP